MTEARTRKGPRPLPSPIIARLLRRPARHLAHRYFVPAPEPLGEPVPVLPELLLLPPPVVSVDDDPVEEGEEEELELPGELLEDEPEVP